jgi:hypothetical protein
MQHDPPRVRLPPEPGTKVALVENVSGGAPLQGTEVTIARSAGYLLVRFECEDAQPWATITRRDGPLYQEEVIEVFLDPFGDLECYFEIEVNPLNAVLDLMLRRVGKGWRKEFGWKCEGLETSVAMTESGWTAEMAIPFAALVPEPPAIGDVWRANFLRIDRPAGCARELSAWSATGRNGFHEPGRFGFVEF